MVYKLRRGLLVNANSKWKHFYSEWEAVLFYFFHQKQKMKNIKGNWSYHLKLKRENATTCVRYVFFLFMTTKTRKQKHRSDGTDL